MGVLLGACAFWVATIGKESIVIEKVTYYVSLGKLLNLFEPLFLHPLRKR